MGFSNIQRLLLVIMLISAFVLGSALIYDYFLNPPLSAFCLAQKLLLGIIALLGLLGGIGGFSRLAGGVIALSGGAGAWLSLEQLSLQQAPQEMMPGCLPPLSYLMDVFPLSELVTIVFSVNGECAGIHPVIGGLSIPSWSLGLFTALLLSGLRAAFGTQKKSVHPIRKRVASHEKKHSSRQNK